MNVCVSVCERFVYLCILLGYVHSFFKVSKIKRKQQVRVVVIVVCVYNIQIIRFLHFSFFVFASFGFLTSMAHGIRSHDG